MILPGATIGILGSGQLGRMLSFQAKRMGYRVHVFSPDGPGSPAGQVSDIETVADYLDFAALEKFAHDVDVVTIEFENIPSETLEFLQKHIPVRPGPNVLHIAQNRLREKTFLNDAGLPVVPFKQIDQADQITTATESLGFPCVMKTSGFGYDGKGQAILHSAEEAKVAYEALGKGTVILEAFINYQQELSVIGVRSPSGEYTDFGVIENDHEHHILDVSVAPSSLSEEIQNQAKAIAKNTLASLDVLGVLCVEMFLTTDDQLLINEVAPRPHNSGHLTIEGCASSQFEQQLRAVCDLPLGSTEFIKPAAMTNLLGDVWADGEPAWDQAINIPEVYLHLYGKSGAKPGRKMGHVSALGATPEEARTKAQAAREALQNR